MELMKTIKEIIISCYWEKNHCDAILILVSRNQKTLSLNCVKQVSNYGLISLPQRSQA